MRLDEPRQRAQAVAEYVISLGLVVAAIVGMQLYAKRSIQAKLKVAADQLRPAHLAPDPTGEKTQSEGIKYETGERRNRAVTAAGTVKAREFATTTTVNRSIDRDTLPGGGRRMHILNDMTQTAGAVTGHGPGVSFYSEVTTERAGQ